MTGLSIPLDAAHALTRLAISGDELAFAALVRRFQPVVFQWAITLSGDEDTADARAHATACRDCDRVTRVVVERERGMLVAYAGLASTTTPTQLAASAFALSNRRRVAIYYKVILAAAALATVSYMVLSRAVISLPGTLGIAAGTPVAAPPARMHSEMFEIRCVSLEKAAAMLRTHLQGDARVTFRPSSLPGFITVDASRQQIIAARDILRQLERSNESACALPTAVAPSPP